MSYTIKFETLKWPATRKLKCRACGKSFRRSRTFTMTQNPWNKNEDGSVRTREQIYAALRDIAAEWIPDDQCGKCADAADHLNEVDF